VSYLPTGGAANLEPGVHLIFGSGATGGPPIQLGGPINKIQPMPRVDAHVRICAGAISDGRPYRDSNHLSSCSARKTGQVHPAPRRANAKLLKMRLCGSIGQVISDARYLKVNASYCQEPHDRFYGCLLFWPTIRFPLTFDLNPNYAWVE
jgi:hypothetical protein